MAADATDRPSWLQWVTGVLESLRSIAVSIAVLVLFAILFWVGYQSLYKQKIRLVAINVSDQAKEQGLSPDILTRLVVLRVREMRQETNQNRSEKKPNEHGLSASLDDTETDSELKHITLPGVEVSLDELIHLANRILGRSDPSIEFEIVDLPSTVDRRGGFRIGKRAFSLEVRLTDIETAPNIDKDWFHNPSPGVFDSGGQDDLVEAMAQRLIALADPYTFSELNIFDSPEASVPGFGLGIAPLLGTSDEQPLRLAEWDGNWRAIRQSALADYLQPCADGTTCHDRMDQANSLSLLAWINENAEDYGAAAEYDEKDMRLLGGAGRTDILSYPAKEYLSANRPTDAERLARVALQRIPIPDVLPVSLVPTQPMSAEVVHPWEDATAVLYGSLAHQLDVARAERMGKRQYQTGLLSSNPTASYDFDIARAALAAKSGIGSCQEIGADGARQIRALDNLGAIAAGTRWPAILEILKGVTATASSCQPRADIWLKAIDHADGVSSIVGAFRVLRKGGEGSVATLDAAELSLLAQTLLPSFDRQLRGISELGPFGQVPDPAIDGTAGETEAVRVDLSDIANNAKAPLYKMMAEELRALLDLMVAVSEAEFDRDSADLSKSTREIEESFRTIFIVFGTEGCPGLQDLKYTAKAALAYTRPANETPADTKMNIKTESFSPAVIALCRGAYWGSRHTEISNDSLLALRSYELAQRATDKMQRMRLLMDVVSRLSSTFSPPPGEQFLLGKALFELDRFDDAANAFKGEFMAYHSPSAMVHLGWSMLRLGRQKDALWEIEYAADHWAEDYRSFIAATTEFALWAEAQRDRKAWREASTLLETAIGTTSIELRRGDDDSYPMDFNAIILLCKLGRPAEARAQAERLMQEAGLSSEKFADLAKGIGVKDGIFPGKSRKQAARLAAALLATPNNPLALSVPDCTPVQVDESASHKQPRSSRSADDDVAPGEGDGAEAADEAR
ncbi:MAG TPA: hypothetical protein VMM15_25750 [Bradyrhizobium sp.]|nr:hypothetical protein [Bradyrhizobium sp.]